ncbi:MAG: hypothetical protein CSA45_03790 [Gammaproteobacteria bacterium]|nr:MAG: hypothetical protein CSA45_03790 [Gammaproteobacteria bacterium]
MSKEVSKKVRIFSLIISIVLVFVLWFIALSFVNSQFKGLSPDQVLKGEIGTIIPMAVIAFFLAGIIPTLILKFTSQTKKSIITLVLAGVMDFIIINEWMTVSEKEIAEITSKLGYSVIGAFVAVAIVTIVLIAKSGGKTE